jgi:hypothetical protein
VADEIHRPPWRQVELGQGRGERAPQRVRRAPRDLSLAARRQQLVARSTEASTIVRRMLSTVLRRPLRVANTGS